jgi:hypothetical protein
MATKDIKSINLLPEFLKTEKNSKFLASTLDQLINPAQLERIEGYIGSTITPNYVSTSDIYISETTQLRRNYQLEPACVVKDSLGKILSEGWHTRLTFMRKWGKFNKFEIPDETTESENPDSPVVAVTIARMKFLEIPRFIHWGRPVEKLVRDHPATTLSLASNSMM